MLVLVVCLCPSSVHVVATFPGTVLFPLLCSVLQFLSILSVGPFLPFEDFMSVLMSPGQVNGPSQMKNGLAGGWS